MLFSIIKLRQDIANLSESVSKANTAAESVENGPAVEFKQRPSTLTIKNTFQGNQKKYMRYVESTI